MVHMLCEAAISDLPQVINITNKVSFRADLCELFKVHRNVLNNVW